MSAKNDRFTDFDRAAFQKIAQKMIVMKRPDSGLSKAAHDMLSEALLSFCQETGANTGGVVEQLQASNLRSLALLFADWLKALDDGRYAGYFFQRSGPDVFVHVRELHTFFRVNRLFSMHQVNLTQAELKRLLTVLGLTVDRPFELTIDGKRHRSLTCLNFVNIRRLACSDFSETADFPAD
ncbi:MAG: hypothetical protein GZ090_11885 [Oxalobacteraceae bacterium]|nr:hypothetical protein [Oxalobacteraceae bacterium]